MDKLHDNTRGKGRKEEKEERGKTILPQDIKKEERKEDDVFRLRPGRKRR